MYAASHGQEEVISLFISVFRNDIRALQLHRRNNDGLTALHLAVRNRHENCARLLTREAQCFPSGLERFPDPRELDREPTPTVRKLKVIASVKKHMSKENKRSTGTMTVDINNTSANKESSLSVLECSVGDIPAWNYTHPFGLQTTKCTQVISIQCEKKEDPPPEETKEMAVETKDSPRIDEWPAIPLQLKQTSQKVSGPLMPLEAPATHPNTFHRKCLLKENNCNLNGLRVKTRDSGDNKHFKHNLNGEEDIISGSSVKALQLHRNRQTSGLKKESTVNLLPLIPCNKDIESLPPVKYSIRRSGSSKKDAGFSSASYITIRADQTPRDIETFKKNLVALS